MGSPQSNLPPGFRFHPTDQELILHYLSKKVASIPLPVSIIAEVDIYKLDPWDLPAKATFGEKEWYFFSPRDRKYPNGARPNRAAASGYWKATGTDKTIVTSLQGGAAQENVGVKKALVFYEGRPPKGVKTNWIMHEYRLVDNNKPIKLKDSSMRLDDWVLCRIYKKSKHALTSAEATIGVGEVDQAEEHLFKETLLPILNFPTPPPQTTLMSQKSVSFSNLLDAMDYSVLSSFLSENHSNPAGIGSSAGFNSENLEQQSSPINNPTNSYTFQKNTQLNPSLSNMESMRPKRQVSNIDDETLYPSKKYLSSSCNFPTYENPQWNYLVKQSLLNQRLLLGPHWEMANSSLSQRLMPIQTPPCHASGALTRSSQSQSNGILEECWPLNMNSKPNTGSRCDAPLQNGFCPGSSSGSKEPSLNISSISYDYLNHKNDSKIMLDHFINNVSSKSCRGSDSNCNNLRSGKDIDLNVLLPNGSSNNLVPQSGTGIIDGEQKNEECHVMLPWLRGKTTCKNGVQNSAGESGLFRAASLSNNDETGKEPMHNITSVLCSNDIEVRRTEVYERPRDKKILGVPIFEKPHISAKELSSITSPSVSNPNPSDVKTVENKKKQIFDINLPCDAAAVELDNEAFTETAASKTRSPAKADSRNQIDLNLSMSEDEGSFTTIPSDNVKMKTDIDLEAPVVVETEENVLSEEKPLENSLPSSQVLQNTVEQPKDNELMTKAAEAIVVLSSLSCEVDVVTSESPSECPKVDLLNWFADIASSCKDNQEGKCDVSREKDAEDNDERSYGGLDYFEAMTLNLPHTKEEDYMPKPLVPENFKVEETITLLPTRTRKGPARRGRQRRDFQRDILPGLASLSRHEVTEDLQTFGGIMRGTGYSWNSGLTRRSSSRNGGGRGRRRTQVAPSPPTPMATNETSTPLMQQLNNIEIGLEDRSLTGWGKTTRRPRRQRCPAGNPPLIQLT